MRTWTSPDSMVEVREGDSRVVAADETCDLLCTDTPFSATTHEAYDDNCDQDEKVLADNTRWAAENGKKALRVGRKPLPYAPWTPEDAQAFVAHWAPRTRGWMVIINDEFLAPVFKKAMEDAGRCVFALLPLYQPGSRIRISGDGPSNWTCWIAVSRPRTQEYRKWGTLPGGYSGPSEDMAITGGKPLWAMKALVRDYSRAGNRVIDPCCGSGTTSLAAAIMGRPSLTTELDPATYDIAVARLQKPRLIDMFPDSGTVLEQVQYQTVTVPDPVELAAARDEGYAAGWDDALTEAIALLPRKRGRK